MNLTGKTYTSKDFEIFEVKLSTDRGRLMCITWKSGCV